MDQMPSEYFFLLAADVNGVWRAHAHLDRQIITECDDESIFHVHGWATSVVGGYLGILTPELNAIRTTFADREKINSRTQIGKLLFVASSTSIKFYQLCSVRGVFRVLTSGKKVLLISEANISKILPFY
jgi:hypothetical protein